MRGKRGPLPPGPPPLVGGVRVPRPGAQCPATGEDREIAGAEEAQAVTRLPLPPGGTLGAGLPRRPRSLLAGPLTDTPPGSHSGDHPPPPTL